MSKLEFRITKNITLPPIFFWRGIFGRKWKIGRQKKGVSWGGGAQPKFQLLSFFKPRVRSKILWKKKLLTHFVKSKMRNFWKFFSDKMKIDCIVRVVPTSWVADYTHICKLQTQSCHEETCSTLRSVPNTRATDQPSGIKKMQPYRNFCEFNSANCMHFYFELPLYFLACADCYA